MSSSDAIGGYFELELSTRGGEYHSHALSLNSARSGFEYILRTQNPKKVYIPKYICDVMLQPLERSSTNYEFYSIDNQLEIKELPNIKDDEMIVYVNYFGIKDEYSRLLSRKLGSKLVLDCSQAFFYKSEGSEHTIYSSRKFFGVADGGYVYTSVKSVSPSIAQDHSNQRMGHLLKRLELGPEAGYEEFKKNDAQLSKAPIQYMSRLTSGILASLNYPEIKQARSDNFMTLHRNLGSNNLLNLSAESVEVPMVYPYFTHRGSEIRRKLIDAKIFTATYWPNIFEWCREDETEYLLARDIIPLPIDQRYKEADMMRILEVLNED